MSAMPEPQQTIALVVRHNTAGINQPVQAIVDFLRVGGYRVVLEQQTAGHVEVAGVDAMAMDEIGNQANWPATTCRSSASTRAAWAS
jgi:NAD+ kinase